MGVVNETSNLVMGCFLEAVLQMATVLAERYSGTRCSAMFIRTLMGSRCDWNHKEALEEDSCFAAMDLAQSMRRLVSTGEGSWRYANDSAIRSASSEVVKIRHLG